MKEILKSPNETKNNAENYGANKRTINLEEL